ncbi:hypothetical protein GUJ93_ZPchr0014g46754 [Zizania palustris]|uniref:Uncharacterized protein n=1 Tax=Zizania palustris TaxID=103762 RepID=A0A8J5W5N1_ZIZPA|nr:hypothetical protein GUJ93_ZPchr0014g46754 [Zizania palustris]
MAKWAMACQCSASTIPAANNSKGETRTSRLHRVGPSSRIAHHIPFGLRHLPLCHVTGVVAAAWRRWGVTVTPPRQAKPQGEVVSWSPAIWLNLSHRLLQFSQELKAKDMVMLQFPSHAPCFV